MMRRLPALNSVAPPLAVILLAMWLVPGVVSSYWLFVLTTGVIAIPIMQSLGVITGRIGVMSLCQMSFAMLGAWVTGWCNVAGIPGGFWVWMIVGGVAAVPAGLLIGFPALRLRGVSLAIVTFAFATAMDVVFSSLQFPGTDSFKFVARPAGFVSDGGYFRFAIVVVAVLAVGLYAIDHTRIGASWLELRYSERGAAAHGTSVAYSKLAAFGLSAFIAGIGGALIVGQTGSTTPAPFTSQTSLTEFAIAVVIGVRSWDAAVVAGLLGALSPVLLDQVHVPSDYVGAIFGVSAVLILAKGNGQLGQSEIMRARRQAKQVRELLDRKAAEPAGVNATSTPLEGVTVTSTPRSAAPPAAAAAPAPPAPAPAAAAAALELTGLTVRFGAVVAVNEVSISVPAGAVTALIGPNGAGKSTLVNAATGFVDYQGSVCLDGRVVDGLPPHRRARRGLRRSFQQLRVPPTLTAGMYLSVAAGRGLTAREAEEILAWFGCPPPQVPVGAMDAGTRRMLEVAGLTAGRPPVLLLDEPAAGQGERERRLLSRRIAQIPARTGSSVLLIEHDVDLVRAACDWLVVMDFGAVIASGRPDAVLAEPRVIEAYLGNTRPEQIRLTDQKGGVGMRMIPRFRHTVLGAVLAVVALAGCGNSGAATGNSSSGPIVIGGMFTLTPFPFGTDAEKTAQQVFANVNAAGGIGGRKIQYLTGDDAGSPAKAAELARKFVGSGAVVMDGSASFVDCGTNQGYYLQSGILAIQSIGVDPFCYSSPNIVSVEVSPFSQITADLFYASQYLHDSRICLFQPVTPGTGQAIAQAITRWSAATGKKLLIDDDSLPTNQTDFTPELLRAKAERCDAVFYGGGDVVAAAILKGAQGQGMSDVDFMFVSVSYTTQLATTAGNYGLKVYATTGVYPYTIAAPQNAAWRAVAAKAGASPTAFAEAGYVSASWIVDVLKSIKGPITRESVSRALHAGAPFRTQLVAVPLVFGTSRSHDRGQGINLVTLRAGSWSYLRAISLPAG